MKKWIFKLAFYLFQLKWDFVVNISQFYNKITFIIITCCSGIYRRNGIIDFLFFREFRELLGGRVRAIISGSSPIDRDVLCFIRAVLSCPVSLIFEIFFV